MRGGSVVATISAYRHIQDANSFQPVTKWHDHQSDQEEDSWFYQFVLKTEYWLYGLTTRSELEEYYQRGYSSVRIDFTSETSLEVFLSYKKNPTQFFVDSDEENELVIKQHTSKVKVATAADRDHDSQGSSDSEETAA